MLLQVTVTRLGQDRPGLHVGLQRDFMQGWSLRRQAAGNGLEGLWLRLRYCLLSSGDQLVKVKVHLVQLIICIKVVWDLLQCQVS